MKFKIQHWFLLAALSLIQTGCLLTYLVKSGRGQYEILSERQPIEKALASDKLSDETKRKLKLAVEAREFSVSDLGLKPTNNYKTYVELNRPFVSWVVIASPRDKVESYIWKYPIVGRLPYKGFFKLKDAEKEAKKFDSSKYDVHVRGVTAYSTLGWFNDPILSSMLRGDDSDLVNLIIHESVHATLFIKSHADFNERLATFLGDSGTELFYKKKEGEKSPTLLAIENENHDAKLFSEFVSIEVKKLNEWYENEKKAQSTVDESRRQARLNEIKLRFQKEVKKKMKTKKYDKFDSMKLNNAVLASIHTYVYDLSDFRSLLLTLKGDYKEMIKFCKSLEGEKNPAQKLKEFLRQSN